MNIHCVKRKEMSRKISLDVIHLFPKWPPFKYFFIFILISL